MCMDLCEAKWFRQLFCVKFFEMFYDHGTGWRKPKSDHEEETPSEPGNLDRRESKSESHFHRTGLKGKMSFKTASQATLTFLSARRRIEGGLKQLGKKIPKHDLAKGKHRERSSRHL